jgi:hypothetical protein
MPKVIYSASKGLYQTSGSGIEIGDVAVVEEAESLTAGDLVMNSYGSSSLTTTGATLELSLAVNTNVGAVKFITHLVDGGGEAEVTLTGSGLQDDGATALNRLDFANAGEHALLISDGTQWLCVSTTAQENA